MALSVRRFAFYSSCEITHFAPILSLSFWEVYGDAGLTDQKYTGVVTLGLYRLSTSPFSTFFLLDFSHIISAPDHLDGPLITRCAFPYCTSRYSSGFPLIMIVIVFDIVSTKGKKGDRGI
jgi:hypothetical protein